MAKQTGPFLIRCTIDGVCFYIANGEGCARASNPPEAKRVKKAPAFAEFRRYSDYLKQASPLASAMHKKLPRGKQRHHYQRLAGIAIRGMKAGGDRETVVRLMEQEAELICKEIHEGVVTAVVHGEQAWKVKWKDGGPVLQKRRRKTAILKSSASVQQRQAFEELKEGGDWKLGVDSLELGVDRVEKGGDWKLGVGSLELGVDGVEKGSDCPVFEVQSGEGRGRGSGEKCEVERGGVKGPAFEARESDLFNFSIQKPLVRWLADRAVRWADNGEAVAKDRRRGRANGRPLIRWPSG